MADVQLGLLLGSGTGFRCGVVLFAAGEWYGFPLGSGTGFCCGVVRLPLEAARLAACKCSDFPLKMGRCL